MKGHHTTLGTPLESLGLVTRISPLDFFEFVDSVAEIVSRCSFSIIREFTGSPRLIKTVVIAMVYSHCHPHHHKWDIPIRSVAALLFCKFASSSSSFACLSNQIMQVATKSGLVPVNAAKQSSPRAAASISTARHVNTVALKQKVNAASPTKYSYFKAHSPLRSNLTAVASNSSIEQYAEGQKGEKMLFKSLLVYDGLGGQQEKQLTISPKTGNPQYASRLDGSLGIFDSGCVLGSMTGNKSYLIDYQDINGGFVAFVGSPKGERGRKKRGREDRGNGEENESDMKEEKQHKASCKTKLVSSISHPLQMLHMDLFGPTFVRSINHKIYCLVVTDDYSRFSWVFFLATKDETSRILKTFITGIENQINHKVKIIICDNGTEFKNNDMNQFNEMKGIKREFSVARTPQQNGVAERKNRTLIEAARTMLADSLLPTTFWAEAVNTACYV
ncbi:putative ribonuclease H-like domain-containing protein [Tanacetum coccineum]